MMAPGTSRWPQFSVAECPWRRWDDYHEEDLRQFWILGCDLDFWSSPTRLTSRCWTCRQRTLPSSSSGFPTMSKLPSVTSHLRWKCLDLDTFDKIIWELFRASRCLAPSLATQQPSRLSKSNPNMESKNENIQNMRKLCPWMALGPSHTAAFSQHGDHSQSVTMVTEGLSRCVWGSHPTITV